MSELADQIAEVLRAHTRIKYDHGIAFCECGARWDANTGHAAHVAERIEAELQPNFDLMRWLLAESMWHEQIRREMYFALRAEVQP